MRSYLASASLAPIVLGLITASASAATLSITTKQTTPVLTSTAVSGAPGDVDITSSGSIVPASGTAVTLNSANKVTNEGTIQFTDVDNATGILATAGSSGSITNSGAITLTETYTATDTDGDGDLDGPFAKGTNRIGIHTAGAFTGTIANSGSITIKGNKSAGIALDGPLTGSLQQTGTISVTGDDSVGVRAGAISGDVRIAGSIAVQGARATGVALNGDIGGALVFQGAVSATGYRYTTPPADTSKLDADDLLQGGPAVSIAGNVAGGVIFAIPSTSSTDTSQGSAVIIAYGAAPAVQIGAADHDISLGAVAGDAGKDGLVIDGSIAGNGVYSGIAGNGLVIGGQGGAVNISGGMAVHGSVSATSLDASATAIRIGSGATVPVITSSGVIQASGGSKAAAITTALQIDAGAHVSTITNSGTIAATAGGTDATAIAIIDRSGTVNLVTNSGRIAATGADASRATAIDLSAATGDTIIRQPAAASGASAPSITGNIRFGSGNDLLDVADGTVTGNTSFGAGANTLALSGDAAYTGNVQFGAGNDTMTLAGTSSFTGNADFGGGADTLAISGTGIFSGTLANSGGLAVKVAGGTLGVTSTGAVQLASLAVSGGGTIGVTIDPTTGAATHYQIAGAASFAAGSKIAISLTDIAHSVGTYNVISAGSLSGGNNLSATGAVLPYLFKSSVSANDATGQVSVSVARKSASELGLNRSEASAYDAVYAAISKDKPIGDSFLSITDGANFGHALRSMLPEHAGGAFEDVTSASRSTARMLADPDAPIVDRGRFGFWLQQVAWGRSKSLGDTAGYHVSGWGVSGGGEIAIGDIGRFGVSLAYLAGEDNDLGTSNTVNSSQYELGAYWRADWGHLHAFARGSAAHIDFSGKRHFSGMDGDTDVSRFADGNWNGRLISGAAGLSWRADLGAFSLRPQVSIDYYRLREGGYAETGGGDGFDLTVNGRTSDELAASGAVALGYSLFDDLDQDGGFLRVELEGGRRQLVGGSLGNTTAHFAGGQNFTLVPEDRTNGWTGALRLKGGNAGFTMSSEFNAEQQQSHVALALRAGLQVGF